ncbi:MAG: hypothetical protein OHK0040_06970 [bacterium]
MIKQYALRLLERFIYSEKALRAKIISKFPDSQDEADKVINELKELGFIDDKRNAKYYVELLVSRGYGRYYIKRFLMRKGFPEYGEIGSAGNEAMEKWFLKKSKMVGKLDRKGWQKIFFYLRSKGFSTEEIHDFMRKRGGYEGE